MQHSRPPSNQPCSFPPLLRAAPSFHARSGAGMEHLVDHNTTPRACTVAGYHNLWQREARTAGACTAAARLSAPARSSRVPAEHLPGVGHSDHPVALHWPQSCSPLPEGDPLLPNLGQDRGGDGPMPVHPGGGPALEGAAPPAPRLGHLRCRVAIRRALRARCSCRHSSLPLQAATGGGRTSAGHAAGRLVLPSGFSIPSAVHLHWSASRCNSGWCCCQTLGS